MLLVVAGWAWYLTRVAWAVRLTAEGYAVRLLGGVGVATAAWSQVEEVVAASPGGTPVPGAPAARRTRDAGCRWRAIAGDPDAFARDVRRRVRDAHTPGDPTRT